MKRILLAAVLAFATVPALAADLPPPGPAPSAPATYVPYVEPGFSWSGFYLGINGGYALGTTNWTDNFGNSTGDFSANGFLIGGTAGANYQWGSIVFGIEGDGDWTNVDGVNTTACISCETKSSWLATVRGRMGYAWDRVLVYTTAGGAFANVQAGAQGGPYNATTQVGWTAGVGVEGAFAPNWTARVEYLFVDLSDQSCGVAICGGFSTQSVSLNESIVRAGIDYKFAW